MMRGHTYFDWRHGFSINEYEFPNIHVSWGGRMRGFYVCLSEKLRFYRFWSA